MKTKEEVMSMGLVDMTDVRNLEGRVFFSGVPTDCMQLRTVDEDGFSSFVCGIDMWEMKSGSWKWATTLGFWGYNIMGLIKNIVRYDDDHSLKKAYALYVCDDTPEYKTGEEDEDGYPIYDKQPSFLGCGEPVDFALKGLEEIKF